MKKRYWCDNCDEDLNEDEALRVTPGSYNNLTQRGYDGEAPSVDLAGCCPLCGGVDCVREN